MHTLELVADNWFFNITVETAGGSPNPLEVLYASVSFAQVSYWGILEQAPGIFGTIVVHQLMTVGFLTPYYSYY